jgi:asparagine synthase (glutamine-hydrolysing)
LMDRTLEILNALVLAVNEQATNKEFALLFSGGLDSSILARIARTCSSPRLYTVGIEGAHDLRVAERTAKTLDIPWVGIVVDEGEVISEIASLSRLISTDNALIISFEMPLYFVAKTAEETLLMSGQGADEIFGGYARYLTMSCRELEVNMRKDLVELMSIGVSREDRIAESFGKHLNRPFLHSTVLKALEGIPTMEHIHNGVRKVLLREVGAQLGLGDVALREKKAAQYGSGIMKTIRSAAKRRSMTLGSFVRYIADKGESP